MKRYTLIGGPRHQQQLTHTPTADSSEGALPSSITVTDPQEPWKQIEYLAKTWVTADAEKATEEVFFVATSLTAQEASEQIAAHIRQRQ